MLKFLAVFLGVTVPACLGAALAAGAYAFAHRWHDTVTVVGTHAAHREWQHTLAAAIAFDSLMGLALVVLTAICWACCSMAWPEVKP